MNQTLPARPNDILRAASRVTHLPIKEIIGESQKRRVVRARVACAHIIRDAFAEPTLEEIADVLGYRDHTSVLYHLTKKPDAPTKAVMDAILQNLQAAA